MTRFSPLKIPRSNGRVQEGHARRSSYFKTCHNEGEIREFQIVSTNPKTEESTFRCTNCGFLVKVSQNKKLNNSDAVGENK